MPKLGRVDYSDDVEMLPLFVRVTTMSVSSKVAGPFQPPIFYLCALFHAMIHRNHYFGCCAIRQQPAHENLMLEREREVSDSRPDVF